MAISETGSVQGRAEWVEVMERYRGGSRVWAARGTRRSRANSVGSTNRDVDTGEDHGNGKTSSLFRPYRACVGVRWVLGRCPRLICCALSALASRFGWSVFRARGEGAGHVCIPTEDRGNEGTARGYARPPMWCACSLIRRACRSSVVGVAYLRCLRKGGLS